MIVVSYHFPAEGFPQRYQSDRDAIAEWFCDNVGPENLDWGINGYWFSQMHYWVRTEEIATLFYLRWQ